MSRMIAMPQFFVRRQKNESTASRSDAIPLKNPRSCSITLAKSGQAASRTSRCFGPA